VSLLLLLIPLCAHAENDSAAPIPYSVEEGVLTISRPSDFVVFQHGFAADSSEARSLERLGLDADELSAYMTERSIYLIGISLLRSSEFNIVIANSSIPDFSAFDDEYLTEGYAEALRSLDMGVNDVTVNFYPCGSLRFLEATFSQRSGPYTQYNAQYYILLNRKAIYINYVCDNPVDLTLTRSIIDSISFGMDSRPVEVISALSPDSPGNISSNDLLLAAFAVYLLISVSFAVIRRHTMTEKAASVTLLLILCAVIVIYTVVNLSLYGRFVLRFEYLILPVLLNLALTKLLTKHETPSPINMEDLID
jgi:hypothetical protein